MRSRSMTFLVVTSMLAASSLVQAQTPSSGSAPSAEGDKAQVSATASTQAEGSADLSAARRALQERGAKISAGAKAKADAQLEAVAHDVDQNAAKGDAEVASRLAAEFGTTAQALIDERTALKTSWGALMIAHALVANATTDLTVEQLVQMNQGGMGWGQIVAGMGLNLGSVVSGVKTEGKVAQGMARADGRVAVIHGEGARAGLGAGQVRAGAAVGRGVSVGVGAGAKVGK